MSHVYPSPYFFMQVEKTQILALSYRIDIHDE